MPELYAARRRPAPLGGGRRRGQNAMDCWRHGMFPVCQRRVRCAGIIDQSVRGNQIVKVLPAPSVLSTVTLPPWRRTI